MINIPNNIDTTKIYIPISKNVIDVRAGPGHNPPIPQPIPNTPAPKINLKSKSFDLGKGDEPAKKSNDKIEIVHFIGGG